MNGTATRLTRSAGYFGPPGRESLGWLHWKEAAPGGLVAVICAAHGVEYVHSHRTVRHLADRLAADGVPALRFDYPGAGDSPGDELAPGAFQSWRDAVAAAAAEARRLTGCRDVALVGIRLGAWLAALAAEAADARRLVLWQPPASGRRYWREMQAVAAASGNVAAADGVTECAGFPVTAETAAALSGLTADSLSFLPGTRILLMSRADRPAEDALAAALRQQGAHVEPATFEGYDAMMAEPHFNAVPDAALDRITAWLADPGTSAGAPPDPACRDNVTLPAGLVESICRPGEGHRLAGILTVPTTPTDRVVVLFNAGSVHHVGPNRLYVQLARALATRGLAVLRVDLHGLGDSLPEGALRENHPYPDTAQRDAAEVFAWLAARGYRHLVPAGLCSGAHTAFHAGLSADPRIREVVLINPLTFRWKEGMSLATVSQFRAVAHYRESARDPSRWLKLLSGRVKFRALAATVAGHLGTQVRATLNSLRERWTGTALTGLSADLATLASLRRPVLMVLADGDPGRDILMAEAGHAARRSQREGLLTIRTFGGADHTFSYRQAREAMIEALAAELASRSTPPA